MFDKYKTFAASVFFALSSGLTQEHSIVQDGDPQSALMSSVSVCMEVGAVANKIEITKTAIERAAIMATGMASLYSGSEDVSQRSCDLKLV